MSQKEPVAPEPGCTVEQLASALIRVNLPETENIFRIAGSKLIESDEDRHSVAAKLADISREKKHQLRDVIKQLNQEMGGLDRSIINCLVFMNRATELWNNDSPLDPFVKKAFMKRRYILAALLLDQPEFVLDEAHPVNEIMALVEKLFIGWEEEKGQPPAFVMNALNALTRLLDADHCLIREEQELAKQALFESWEKEKKRRKMLEDRMIQTESGLDNVWFAQQKAASIINRFASGKSLPPDVCEFLSGVWFDSLKLVLLEQGEDSAEFQKMSKLTDRIVFTYRAGHNAGQKQRMYDYAAHLVEEVEKHLWSLPESSTERDRTLEALQRQILMIVQGKEPERVAFNDFECELRESTPEQIEDEKQIISEQVGSWFRRFNKLTRLVCYLPRQRAVLWGDFSGRKSAQESAEQFCEEIRSGNLHAFEASVTLQEFCRRVAKELVDTDITHRRQLQAKLDKERKIREAAKQKAEAEARALMEAREAARKREEEERRAHEEKMRQQAIEEAERKALEEDRRARDQIDELKIGGWVLLTKDEKQVKAKLGVRFKATGRLVFVDEYGIKLAEVMRDDAVEMIKTEKLRFLGADADLEERLSRAVGRIGIAKR